MYPKDFWTLFELEARRCGTSPADLMQAVGYNLLLSRQEMMGWLDKSREMINKKRKEGWTDQHFGIYGWVRNILIDNYHMAPSDASEALSLVKNSMLDSLIDDINKGGDTTSKVREFARYVHINWCDYKRGLRNREADTEYQEFLRRLEEEEEEEQLLYEEHVEEREEAMQKVLQFEFGRTGDFD